jgi:hypothetical protein
MNLLFWGLTLGTIGKILVAIGILKVHHIMAVEQQIDAKVIRSFAFEKAVTFVGVMLIIAGYLMEIYFYDLTLLLRCHGEDCLQAANLMLSQ